MSNELITTTETTQDENALVVGSTSLYFPRIKLCQGQAKEVLKKLVASGGNFAMLTGKDQVEDLGDTFDIVVCAGRAKALRTKGVIMSLFDKNDAEFAKIREESKDKNSGSMYGPEYLVFLPYAGDEGTFATFFLSNPTMRRESKSIHSRLKKAATVTSHLIESADYSWFGPLFNDCSTPLDIPAQEVFDEAIERFRNEQPSMIETIEESEEGRER